MYEKYVALKNKKGVTDYKVACETGITKSTFTDWKTGRSKPKIDKLAILAKYFGVTIEYFWENEKVEEGNDKALQVDTAAVN